ncbi:hypothetical protein I7I48_02089 [Histoplasma ohiense]|nr:hypothetical protein I7I48_02089 [Histoplasma ohiense (nom. inval.)]
MAERYWCIGRVHEIIGNPDEGQLLRVTASYAAEIDTVNFADPQVIWGLVSKSLQVKLDSQLSGPNSLNL